MCFRDLGFCETLGFKHHLIPVNKSGCVDIDWLKNNIDEKLFLFL